MRAESLLVTEGLHFGPIPCVQTLTAQVRGRPLWQWRFGSALRACADHGASAAGPVADDAQAGEDAGGVDDEMALGMYALFVLEVLLVCVLALVLKGLRSRRAEAIRARARGVAERAAEALTAAQSMHDQPPASATPEDLGSDPSHASDDDNSGFDPPASPGTPCDPIEAEPFDTNLDVDLGSGPSTPEREHPRASVDFSAYTWDAKDENLAQAAIWVSAATGEPLGAKHVDDASVHAFLKSGVVLCRLANRICPGLVDRVDETSAPFPQRENISRFLHAARELGVQGHESFETGDLYNGTGLKQVGVCLGALSRACHTIAGYDGPAYGVRETARLGAYRTSSFSVVTGEGLWGKSASDYRAAQGPRRYSRSASATGFALVPGTPVAGTPGPPPATPATPASPTHAGPEAE